MDDTDIKSTIEFVTASGPEPGCPSGSAARWRAIVWYRTKNGDWAIKDVAEHPRIQVLKNWLKRHDRPEATIKPKPMTKRVLKMAKWVWRSPVNDGAVVLYSNGWQPGKVVVADLDLGTRYTVKLDELRTKVRPSEAADYQFSWTNEADNKILSQVNAW